MDAFDRAAAAVAGNEFDTAAAGVVDDQRRQLRNTLYDALLANPEVAARATRLGRQAGLAPEIVERNLPEVERSVRLDQLDALPKENPVLAAWLADPVNARLAHDDLDTLGQLSQGALFRSPVAPKLSANYGFAQAARDLRTEQDRSASAVSQYVERNLPASEITGRERTAVEGVTEPILRGVARARRGLTLLMGMAGLYEGDEAGLMTRLASQNRQVESYPVPENVQAGQRAISDAEGFGDAAWAILTHPGAVKETVFESLGASSPSLLGAAGLSVFGPAGTAAGAGAGSFVVEYSSTLQDVMDENGVNASDPIALSAALRNPDLMDAAREKALARGVPVAVFDAITAGFAGRLLLGAKNTPGSAAARTAGELGLQAGGGAAGEAVAQYNTDEFKPGDILLEAIAELPTGVVEVPANYRHARDKATRAEQDATAIEDLNRMAASSKVLARDTDTFQSFVAAAAEDGPVDTVYLDGKTLMQSGLAPELATVSPAVAAQLDRALLTGGQIAIPVDEYAARIAPTDLAPQLLDHLRTDPEGFTRAEAQQYMQDAAPELQAEVERILADKQGDDAFKVSADVVKANVKGQLDAAARSRPEVNEAYSAMVGNFYAVQAARLGVTPETLYQRYPLKVGAESVTGQQFDQGAQVETPEFREWFGDSAVVDAEGKPLVVYHGTGADTGDVLRRGTFFTPHTDIAGIYATAPTRQTDSGAPNTIPVYLSIRNPFVYSEKDSQESLSRVVLGRRGKHEEVIAELERRGYDGILYKDYLDLGGVQDQWVPFRPEQIKSAIGNRGTFDPNDQNILHQSGLTPTEQAMQRWRDSLGRVNPRNLDYAPKLDTPAVLREMGVKDAKLALPTRYLMAIRQKHPDVPLEVFDSLPALLADPLFILPSRDGGVDVVIEPVSEAGAPIVVAVRDGRVRTVTPLDPSNEATSAERLAEWWKNALKREGAKFYSRNSEAPAKAGASTGGSSGAHSLALFSPPSARNVVTHADLVKKHGTEFYQKSTAPRGAFNPETLQISLLENADLSTFLHESGHAFLEMQFDMATRLQQEAAAFGIDTLKPGERELLADTDALFQWFGVRDLDEWHALDFEQKRPYHEQFARGFEAYLFEGRAPSIELQGLFQRFRAWLLNVYKNLKMLNVELTDEVRGVMDRMLASTEEIQLAEQARSMMPLFSSADQAGMTPEEFAAYQALGVDATNEAIEDLQSKGLRDMQWLHNARGRIIKQLQKDAEAQRAQVRMDVRREVMSQPIYRAWQFLTGKLTADDKIAPPAKRTSSPDSIDETQDSLFAAIAKLGGLNRAAVQSEWGIDPKERIPMPAFGKHVLRREGGLSIDAMGEALGQYGYLTLDEHGKHDLRQLEDKFFEELRGNTQYSIAYDYAADMETRAGDQVVNPQALGAGRFDMGELRAMGLPTEVINAVQARRMTAGNGLHPDLVAELFGFTSGDELVRKLAAADTPKEVIDALTDLRMLEQFGELASPEAIERAADKSIHNDVRARMVATEANALAKAVGQRRVLAPAAKEFARTMIDRLKVRAIRPAQYASAEVRAARAADKASRAGDLATAAAEKRNQLVNVYATRAAYDAQDEVDAGLRYLKKFGSDGTRKKLDADYLDQIDALLERFDLRKGQSLKAIDKRASLAQWIEAQRAAGLEPDIPPGLENEANRTSYKNLTVEEFRGLLDTVKQIEHLGRLKHKLLTVRDQREFAAVVDEVSASIVEHGGQERPVELEQPGRLKELVENFRAGHRKLASLIRQMDGGKDNGPFWRVFVRGMNEAGTREASMVEDATVRLAEIYKPMLALKGGLNGDKRFIQAINASLTRAGRLSVALNWGNETNRLRVMEGDGWSEYQVQAILNTLTREEWRFVQNVWSFIDSYWPQIEAKEKRVTGRAPDKVQPLPFTVMVDGENVALSGGYYPIKYDANRDDRAEKHEAAEIADEMKRGAFTRASTRRGHTKARTESVRRPVKKTLDVITQHVSEVTHDLAWHEWLIDANRLLDAKPINQAIRAHYGTATIRTMKDALTGIATGDLARQTAVDTALLYLRANVSRSTMGFSLTTAFLQPFGLLQSVVRIGGKPVLHGIGRWAGDVARMESTMGWIGEKSEFMRLRAKTFNRELNEIKNRVSHGHSRIRTIYDASLFMLMQKMQLVADIPTWIGAYDKAMADGMDEVDAVALADQAVLDSQGGGQTKDLAEIQRKLPLLTQFYSYFNTTLNLAAESTARTNFRNPLAVAGWLSDMMLLMVVPALGPAMILALMRGENCWEEGDCARELAQAQLGYLFGTVVGVRELSGPVAGYDYAGPPVGRVVVELGKVGTQVQQGELDEPLAMSIIRLFGTALGIPTTQIVRSWRGWQAWADGDAPATSILMGPPPKD